MTLANRTDVALDREVRDLLGNLAWSLPTDVVQEVVSAVKRDLEGQVPEEAFPEFLHRCAVQRLLDQAVVVDESAPVADPAGSPSRIAK